MNRRNSSLYDYVIIGAGIVGLSVARELLAREPNAKIAVVEKENTIGLHASGRNSGVLHSGIYYQPDSLKAKVCLEGARLMSSYCEEHGLPLNRIGKVIVPVRCSDGENLNVLHQRALSNGASIRLINDQELKEIEPHATTATGMALHAPETAVVDPMLIMKHLHSSLTKRGVHFFFNSFIDAIDTQGKKITTSEGNISYGHLFNTAGLFADKIAHACGLKSSYRILPFKGYYYELSPDSKLQINHLIYPVPDMNVPFLGIHFTKSVSGTVYIGPTAIPALGREHYRGVAGIKLCDFINIVTSLGRQYYVNRQGFRSYTHQEIPRIFKSRFIKSARALVPGVSKSDLRVSNKIGIRAQLYDYKHNELITDFLISRTDHVTHVLNAVSPAFTSAFSFAKWIVNEQKTVCKEPVYR